MGVVSDGQTYLAAQGLIDGATGWPSSRRKRHETDDGRLVVLTEDGGAQSEIPAQEGLGDVASKDPGLQVYVRGQPNKGDAAHAKALEIKDALHGLLDADLGATTYERIVALSEPIFNGWDDQDRAQFTISFRMATQAG